MKHWRKGLSLSPPKPLLRLSIVVALLAPWIHLVGAEYPWLDRVEYVYLVPSERGDAPTWRVSFFDREGLEIGSDRVSEPQLEEQIEYVFDLTIRRRLARFPIFQLGGKRTRIHYLDDENRLCTLVGNVRNQECRERKRTDG